MNATGTTGLSKVDGVKTAASQASGCGAQFFNPCEPRGISAYGAFFLTQRLRRQSASQGLRFSGPLRVLGVFAFGRVRCLSGLAMTLCISAGLAAAAQSTNDAAPGATPATNASPRGVVASPAPSRLDESAFRIVSERNIFNANRSGGQVRLSSRRAPRVESFTLVGTLAYEKGAFAFFEGSSAELTKVLKPDGVIAGHKLVDILADGVRLEADGRITDLAVGAAMRREDEGEWRRGDAVASSSGGSSRRDDDDDSSRSRRREDRDRGSGSASPAAGSSTGSGAEDAEVLRRLMERRERD